MAENPNMIQEPSEFFSMVDRLATPLYAECLTEETTKVKDRLLISSLVLLLFVLGVVYPGETVELLGFKFAVTTGVRWVLLVLCAYFLTLFCVRSYTEWQFWRLKQQATLQGMIELTEGISSDLARPGHLSLEIIELYGKLEELDKDPPEITQMRSELLSVYNQMSGTGGQFQRFMDLNARLDKARDDKESNVRTEREKLLQEYHTKLDEQSRLRDVPGYLLSKLEVLRGQLPHLQRTIRIRLWVEILFPIFFGTIAIGSVTVYK